MAAMKQRKGLNDMFVEAARGSLGKAKTASDKVARPQKAAPAVKASPASASMPGENHAAHPAAAPRPAPAPPVQPGPELDTSRCPRCFAPRAGMPRCATCGCDFAEAQTHPDALPAGLALGTGYTTGEVLERSATGISYRAYDAQAQRVVVLWEYLPQALALRGNNGRDVIPRTDAGESFAHGLRQLHEHAAFLARLDHQNIAPAPGTFTANATAYLVTRAQEGPSLEDRLTERQGLLDWWDEGRAIAQGMLEGLHAAHGKGLILCDISPRNILLTEDGAPVLMNLDATRQAGELTPRAFAAAPPSGYAALELHEPGGLVGPWTDVYAAAAIIYRLLTGDAPPLATERRAGDSLRSLSEVFQGEIPRAFSDCINKALALRAADRWQTAAAFLNELLRAETESISVEDDTEVFVKAPPAPAPVAVPAKAPTPASAPAPAPVAVPAPAPVAVPAKAAAATAVEPVRSKLKPVHYAATIVLLLGVLVLAFAFMRTPSPPSATPVAAPAAAAMPSAAPLKPTGQAAALASPAPASAQAGKAARQGKNITISDPAHEIQTSSSSKAQTDDAAETGTLIIAAQPWGYVLVDGRKTGAVAPVQGMTLPGGRHEIALENPNIAEKRSVVVVVREKKTIKISCTPTGCKVVN